MPEKTDDDALQQAITNSTDSPRAFVRAVQAFYRDRDRADEVPRELLYFHLGLATGIIMRLLDAADLNAHAEIEAVLAALAAVDGHVISRALLDRLPGGRQEWRMYRELGSVFIRDRLSVASERRGGIELTLTTRDRRGATIDAAWIAQHYRASVRPPQ